MIKIRSESIDGCRHTRSFKTLKGARKFAHDRVGEHPEQGSRYAVAADGIVKVTWQGCTFADLFGDGKPAAAEATYVVAGRAYATAEEAAAERDAMIEEGYGQVVVEVYPARDGE